MKCYCCLVWIGIGLFFCNTIWAQKSNTDSLVTLGLKADSMMYVYVNKGDLPTSIKYCKQKEAFFFEAKSWDKFIKAINDKAYLYHALDSLDVFKKLIFVNFELADAHLKNNHPQWIRAKEQINSYYYAIGDYKSALEIIKEVIPIKEKIENYEVEVSKSYLNLGTAYNHLKDYENALISFKKSIKERYKEGETGFALGVRLNNIGRTYNSMGELDSALHYLDLAEQLLESIVEGRYKNRKIETYTLKVETYLKKKDFDKAKEYLDLIETFSLSKREKVLWQERLGKYYYEIKEYRQSLLAISKANQLAEELSTRNSPPLKARRVIDQVKVLIDLKQEMQALDVLQSGLRILSPGFKSEDYRENPEIKNLLDKPDALVLLQEKARILNRVYATSENLDDLTSSFDAYLLACEVIKELRRGIVSSESKNVLAERTVSVYEESIASAYQLYEKSKDKKYILTAFELAERNKAQLLLENLNEQEALGYSGIPDSLFNKEKDLRLYLATLMDRAIREERSIENDEQIFRVRQEYGLVNSFLEKTYPRYFQLKYNNEPIGVNEIQQRILNQNTGMIEYFVGDNQIFVFVITEDDVFLDAIEKEGDSINYINRLRNIIKERPGTKDPNKEYDEFEHASKMVFDFYVKKALDKMPDSIRTLIVIPDDQINYIPFEVLISEKPTTKNNYSLKNQSYLFKDYSINYNYSATLLNKVMTKNSAALSSNFIGYAPTFSEDSKKESRSNLGFELSSLTCNNDEVSAIQSLLGGSKRISENATKINFLKEANQYKIIHLATHAFVNQSDSKQNRIFLQEDFLSDVNLYNLELNTELAVLSACNTGSGELLKGEGVMNLARGFMNAGCSSTLMSMWSVDDCTTSDLMVLFYEGIKKGLSKDEALRQAKIVYLNTSKKAKLHPYYWAAFVSFGDMGAIELNSTWSSSIFFFLGLGLLFIVGGIFFFKNRS
ncbi:MAG: CHAT domain-containing protein [Saprospiraceae bacterium]|nr:CHAT domain-containing protein [Saprospiraceae bacterium]